MKNCHKHLCWSINFNLKKKIIKIFLKQQIWVEIERLYVLYQFLKSHMIPSVKFDRAKIDDRTFRMT